MRFKAIIRVFCYALAVALTLLSFWCVLWIFSSYSMAFTECADTYDLFAANPRCRQPFVAGLLAIAGLLGAIGATLIGRRIRSSSPGEVC
jgi:hypothetical protein